MSRSFIATRSVLLDGRMYQKGERIECVLTRGRAKLLLATQTLEEVDDEKPVVVHEDASKPVVQVVKAKGERNSMRAPKVHSIREGHHGLHR